jgi:HEAT repeat protein
MMQARTGLLISLCAVNGKSEKFPFLIKYDMIKLYKLFPAIIALFLVSFPSYTQDKRTTETKVADLLARLPANDLQLNDRLMGDMLLLGETGIKQVCDQIIPAGTGDDTRPRFAIESLSRFLSQKGKEKEKAMWENVCIGYATAGKDPGVIDFFIKQLQLIGGEQSLQAMKGYLGSQELYDPALGVFTAVGGPAAEKILAESLRDKDLLCAASVMNTLASMNSEIAVNDFITWSKSGDPNIKAAAYNALASSGSPSAYPVLSEAAKAAYYKWEMTGATSSLLKYAKRVGQKGDLKIMENICRHVMSKCNDDVSIQYKTAALHTIVGLRGIESMGTVFQAAESPNKKYRSAAIMMTLEIPDKEVVQKWIGYFPRASQAAKPEIITMFGIRGDAAALPLVTTSLTDDNFNVRKESAEAIVRLGGEETINSLIDYMLLYPSPDDQEAAKSGILSAAKSDKMPLLIPVLKEGNPSARKTAIELLARSRENQYYSEVLPYTSSADRLVKEAAFRALANLAGPDDQSGLLDLLASNEGQQYIADIQEALAAAAGKVEDPERRSAKLLQAMSGKVKKEKIIPVLAKTGGREALAVVLKEFENGNSDTRDICFSTLTNWHDYSASSALYDICASRNKTFEAPAFDSYLMQIRNSGLPDEQKLLLFRKILPFALDAGRKEKIIEEAGNLKIYQSLFFVSGFLDDPALSAAAASSVMSVALPSGGSSTGMSGDLVKDILVKVTGLLKGSESDYDREMVNKYIAAMPSGEGFKPMFNGRDLTGWHGLVENPVTRAGMKQDELARKQAEADKKVLLNWSVRNGCICFNGSGDNLCSVKEYSDFELLADWRITKAGDSGIYLRGTPQVQIWDTSLVDAGAQVGSGGLYNNQKNPSKPLKVADNPVGDWNTFRILMRGEKVTVWLNGELVVDNITFENYWDNNIPIFPKGSIELQAHGTDLAFRDIYIREMNESQFNLTPEEKAEGFAALFNGKDLDNWVGNISSYIVENGTIIVKSGEGSGGNLYTEKEYADFILRFEFMLTPAANNGIGIRAPLKGNAAYDGMEIQVIDDSDPVYANIEPYQHHGSVYGVIPARTGYLKPLGEWNYEEISAVGTKIKVTLNGNVIVDGDIAGPRDNGTIDHKDHPGLKNITGHIGFLGHGSDLKFRNLRIKDLSK